MNMTIKQLADQIGVSKTAVRKHMDEDFRAKYTLAGANGVITISPEGCKLIAEKFQKPPQNTANNPTETKETEVSGDVVAILRETLDALRAQLEIKDEQIRQLNERLQESHEAFLTEQQTAQRAQALQAATMQSLQAPDEAEAVSEDPVAEDPTPHEKRPWYHIFKKNKE